MSKILKSDLAFIVKILYENGLIEYKTNYGAGPISDAEIYRNENIARLEAKRAIDESRVKVRDIFIIEISIVWTVYNIIKYSE